jgi:hypothetical protein
VAKWMGSWLEHEKASFERPTHRWVATGREACWIERRFPRKTEFSTERQAETNTDYGATEDNAARRSTTDTELRSSAASLR